MFGSLYLYYIVRAIVTSLLPILIRIGHVPKQPYFIFPYVAILSIIKTH